MPVPIDGPAGRQEVTDEYRENYDRTFNGTSVCTGCDDCDCTPKKSKQDGGKDAKSNS